MPSHRVHTRTARGDDTSVRFSESPETLARYLEDAAHYPGGHAAAVAIPTRKPKQRRSSGRRSACCRSVRSHH